MDASRGSTVPMAAAPAPEERIGVPLPHSQAYPFHLPHPSAQRCLLTAPQGVQEMLKQCRYLAYFGHVDGPESGGFVMCDNPFEDLLLPAMHPPLTHQPHLCLWTDLTDAEVAKLHGNDWERAPRPVLLPVLEAVRTRNVALLQAIVDTGVDLRCCSPHDMCPPLQLAAQQGAPDLLRILLPYCSAVYAPPYTLEAKRIEGVYESVITQKASEGPSTLVSAMASAEGLLRLILDAPVAPAAFSDHLRPIMECLQWSGGDTFRTLFDVGGPHHTSAPGALQVLLDLQNERAALELLPFLTPNECIELLAGAPYINMLAFQVQFGPVQDLDTEKDGLPLIFHHIKSGHGDAVRFLLMRGCDDTVLSPEHTNILQYAFSCGETLVAKVIGDWRDAKPARAT